MNKFEISKDGFSYDKVKVTNKSLTPLSNDQLSKLITQDESTIVIKPIFIEFPCIRKFIKKFRQTKYDLSKISIIAIRRDENDKNIDLNYMTKEILKEKKRNKNPITLGLNESGQRDISDIFLTYIFKMIKENENKEFENNREYSIYNTTSEHKDNLKEESFKSFIRKTYKALTIEFSTQIMSFILLDRVLCVTKMIMTKKNILRLYIICLIICYQMNEDLIYGEKTLAKVLNFETRLLTILKNDILEILEYDTFIGYQEYRAYLKDPLLSYCLNRKDLKEHILEKAKEAA